MLKGVQLPTEQVIVEVHTSKLQQMAKCELTLHLSPLSTQCTS